MRIGIIGFYHETNSFAIEQNDKPDALTLVGDEVLAKAHPKSYIGGFGDCVRRPDVELVPIVDIRFVRGGMIHADVFAQYQQLILRTLREVLPVDGLYFAFHGAMAAETPFTDAEACIVRSVRELVGDTLPCVATYDFHSIYTPWEVSALMPIPLDTNPHIDAYDRGLEAGLGLLRMLAGEIHPVTRIVHVPIIGPNIGQSTWAHDPVEEKKLPLYRLNLLREQFEEMAGVLNVAIQGGYGYADTPNTCMSVLATTDADPELADRVAKQVAREVWNQREQIRTVRPIMPLDEGVMTGMTQAVEKGLVCLVDLGDDPGSATPADSPAVLESLLRLGARDSVLTIRDPEVVKAGMAAGVGATLTMPVGGKIDQRFYKPLPVTGRVKLIDDGAYMILGPTHGGWGREVLKESFREVQVGPRVVLRIGSKIDVIFGQGVTGKDRDFFKSAGILLEEKKLLVVKSNQAHRASLDPVVAATIHLDTPGACTVNYASLPYKQLRRPLFPIDPAMEWTP